MDKCAPAHTVMKKMLMLRFIIDGAGDGDDGVDDGGDRTTSGHTIC